MIRLKDIAKRARVSVMTVSKVIRDAKDVSGATKARIRKLAVEMGYVPDSQAQSLRSRKTRLFGLLLSSATHPVLARVLMALEEQAHELGYNILVAQSLNQPDREAAIIRQFLARRVDGLFLCPVYRMEPTAPIYDELLRQGIPTILLGHAAPFCEKFPHAATDDLAASQAATRHLIELGHKRIAFFNGLPAAPSSQERLEGYRRALLEAGIEPDDQLVFKAGNTIEEGEKAALQMLNEDTHATALQAVNDLVAVGAGNVFLSQGMRIPEDLSIVGFGNFLISENYRVPLTTMRQPKFQLGVAAFDLMIKLLRGDPPSSKRLSAEIIIRQSTAPPAL